MKKFAVMISGANRGIGLAIAKTLSNEPNYYLSLGVRNESSLSTITQFADKTRVLINHYDAAIPTTAHSWVESTLKQFGQIDGLINCAGISHIIGIDNFDEAKLEEMWCVNTKAPIILTKTAWNNLKQSGHGRVINIASTSGKVADATEFGYNLTKSALLMFTHSIRQAGWKHGIRATALCPGWVNTDMAKNACPLSPENMTQPEDIANIVKMLLALPNTASVAELVVNAECESLF